MEHLPITDAHLHLWDPEVLRYPWLNEVPLLNKPYLMEDYKQHTVGTDIVQMVFVQCECDPEQCERELAWVTAIAGQEPRIKGIVPWAPLELGTGVLPVLERFAQNPLVKGIRRIIQFEDDQDFCLKPGFIEGVRLLAQYGFSFDICISHKQLPKVIALVDQCPEVQFMLDHLAKPDIRQQDFLEWEKGICQLASHKNVECKLSGMTTEADHNSWETADLEPYAQAVVEHFGPDRLVFGGDWPVLLQASGYKRWLETTKELLAHLPLAERKKYTTTMQRGFTGCKQTI